MPVDKNELKKQLRKKRKKQGRVDYRRWVKKSLVAKMDDYLETIDPKALVNFNREE